MLDFTGTSLFIFAHPDDESFYAGGTIQSGSQMGQSIVVSLTKGEKAKSNFSETELAKIRQNEFELACNTLGAKPICLDLGDGKLNENTPNAKNEISEIIKKYQPARIFTFSDEDNYRHKDHITTQKIVTDLGQIFNIEVFYVGPDFSDIAPLRKNRLKTELHYDNSSNYLNQQIFEINYLDNQTFATKLQSINCHKSQSPETLIDFIKSKEPLEKIYKPLFI